jgi:dihydrolipoamide dehydrogenase
MIVGDVTTGTGLLVVGGGPGGYVAAIAPHNSTST